MKEQAFAYVDMHREEIIGLWRELVMQESFFENKAGVDCVAAILQQHFEQLGGKVKYHEYESVGNMLVGIWGDADKAAPIALLGHMDTAMPTGATQTNPFRITDGKAYGPGVLDMKGGIVIALFAMKALQAAGYNGRAIKWILAGDEESTHQNSDQPDKFVQEARGACAAFNFETGFINDGIVIGRKGIQRFILEVKGVAAHVGNDPENGRSAILEMSHKIMDIHGLTDFAQGVSYNVGTIVGGTTPTATPDYCKIVVDVRHKKVSDAEKIIADMQKIADKTYIAGTATKMSIARPFMPMETTEGVMELFKTVQEAAVENNLGAPTPVYVGGASDSAYSVIAGVPTVCSMGVKGGRNHSPEEFAIVDTMFERCKLIIATILKLN